MVRRGNGFGPSPCSPLWFDRAYGMCASLSAAANHPEQEMNRVHLASKGFLVYVQQSLNMWYLYITQNQNGAFYTGITTNLDRRLKEHQRGKGGHYTKRNRPQKLLYTEQFSRRDKAQARESQIKRWSRAKKEALISGNLNELRRLSISRD